MVFTGRLSLDAQPWLADHAALGTILFPGTGLVELGLADPARGDLTLTIGYANDYVGYLCTASAFGEGGYEPATAYPDYLRPGPFSPEVEAALVSTALGLALELGPGA